jgi:hypothetical protein
VERTPAGHRSDPWQAALASLESAHTAAGALDAVETELVVNWASRALEEGHPPTVLATLRLLGMLHPRVATALTDQLVVLASTDRWASEVRAVLGRLGNSTLSESVPAAVRRQLTDEDFIGILRLGELLEHLRLDEALADFVTFTRAHHDPEVRAMAEDYFPESARDLPPR